MYDLYKSKSLLKLYYIILAIVILVIPSIFILTHFKSFNNITATIFFIVFIVLSSIGFKIAHYLDTIKYPYTRLLKLYKINPELKKEYDNAFLEAENTENKVWIGDKYVFIKDETEFKVFLKENIRNIDIVKIKGKGDTQCHLRGECINEKVFTAKSDMYIGYFDVIMEDFNALHVKNKIKLDNSKSANEDNETTD